MYVVQSQRDMRLKASNSVTVASVALNKEVYIVRVVHRPAFIHPRSHLPLARVGCICCVRV